MLPWIGCNTVIGTKSTANIFGTFIFRYKTQSFISYYDIICISFHSATFFVVKSKDFDFNILAVAANYCSSRPKCWGKIQHRILVGKYSPEKKIPSRDFCIFLLFWQYCTFTGGSERASWRCHFLLFSSTLLISCHCSSSFLALFLKCFAWFEFFSNSRCVPFKLILIILPLLYDYVPD